MKPISPIVTPGFKSLITTSFEYLSAHQDELRDRFGLSGYQRYDWDQEDRTIVFSDSGVPKLRATIDLVGSISARTKTWLWAWANQSVSKRASERIQEVKHYGELHGIAQLTEPYWSGDERDGWEMTSVCAYLLKTQGAHRTPNEGGFTYMVLTNVQHAT